MPVLARAVCGGVWALVASVALAAPGAAPASGAPAKRPNIVLLVADDWGFSDVGAFGGEIATPHLDQLAQRGVRFSNFHVAASCSPTRSMLLTGVDNHQNGVGNLREAMPAAHLGKPGYLGSLNERVVTVAQHLQDSGYRTYVTGKWNVGSEAHNLPPRRGFDKSIIQGDTGSDNWQPHQIYLPHHPEVHWFEDGKPARMPADFYSSTYFVDRMMGYLDGDPRQGQPFFAYVAFQANHVPLQAPRRLIDKYKGRYAGGWEVLRQERLRKAIDLGLVPPGTTAPPMKTSGDWSALGASERAHMERQMEVYAAMAEAMDIEIGRLVDHLRTTGQLDNTVFVFLSDNGPEGSDYREAQLWLHLYYTQATDKLGDKGAYGVVGPGWASASASPLYTYKFYAGEGGLRVPMLISGAPLAAGSAGGRVVNALTHVSDIAPTLLQIAQVPTPTDRYKGQPVELMQGKSLLPLLTGAATAVRAANEPLGYELSGNLALFKGSLKLVKNLPPVGDGQWHLYDLSTDPGETHDLQHQMPEAFATLQADYAAYAKRVGVLPMPDGYSPQRQVTINSIKNYWIPLYGKATVATVLALCLAVAAWLRWRKRRRA